MIFADPPDNLGLKYDGFKDQFGSPDEYTYWLTGRAQEALKHTNILWLSVFHKNLWGIWHDLVHTYGPILAYRVFIWRFTFGQHNNTDCGNDYRPILRLTRKDATLYPDAIREPSKRQTLYNDRRANPMGRVPADVWDFPRVCGTFKERRRWHPNQHPEALIERIVKLSCKKDDLVIDMFAGTGTVNRVCKRLGINCIGIEISKYYCEKIAVETGVPVAGQKIG
jgi:site-specific DNA-methyltransferase (adenine-specific)